MKDETPFRRASPKALNLGDTLLWLTALSVKRWRRPVAKVVGVVVIVAVVVNDDD